MMTLYRYTYKMPDGNEILTSYATLPYKDPDKAKAMLLELIEGGLEIITITALVSG